jgi:hypothetical protein
MIRALGSGKTQFLSINTQAVSDRIFLTHRYDRGRSVSRSSDYISKWTDLLREVEEAIRVLNKIL